MKQTYIVINQILYRLMMVIVLLSVIDLVLMMFFGWGSNTVVYWLAMSGNELVEASFNLFVGCLLYFVVTLLLFHKPTNQLVTMNAARMLFLSIAIGAILLGGDFATNWIRGPREQVMTVSVGQYTYQLQIADFDSGAYIGETYNVYECQFNLFCKEIYWIFKGDRIDPDVEKIELVPDSDNDILKIEVNGAVAFTRNPELGTCTVNQGYSDFCRKSS